MNTLGLAASRIGCRASFARVEGRDGSVEPSLALPFDVHKELALYNCGNPFTVASGPSSSQST